MGLWWDKHGWTIYQLVRVFLHPQYHVYIMYISCIISNPNIYIYIYIQFIISYNIYFYCLYRIYKAYTDINILTKKRKRQSLCLCTSSLSFWSSSLCAAEPAETAQWHGDMISMWKWHHSSSSKLWTFPNQQFFVFFCSKWWFSH